MPTQMIPGLAIVAAMVTAAGAIVSGVHRLSYGEWRTTGRTKWDFNTGRRDRRVLGLAAMAKQDPSGVREVKHHS
jgi:NADH-ubiquinone oxidoreductase MWFE subunit